MGPIEGEPCRWARSGKKKKRVEKLEYDRGTSQGKGKKKRLWNWKGRRSTHSLTYDKGSELFD